MTLHFLFDKHITDNKNSSTQNMSDFILYNSQFPAVMETSIMENNTKVINYETTLNDEGKNKFFFDFFKSQGMKEDEIKIKASTLEINYSEKAKMTQIMKSNEPIKIELSNLISFNEANRAMSHNRSIQISIEK